MDFYEDTTEEKSIEFEDIDVTISDEGLLSISEEGQIQATTNAKDGDQVSIHLSYQGVKKTVHVAFTEIEESSGLSQQQMAGKFDYLYDQISNTFYGDLEAHNYNKDYTRIKDEINSYTTDRMSAEVEKFYYDECSHCSDKFFGNSKSLFRWEVYTKVIKDNKNQVIIETFSLGSHSGVLSRATLNKEKKQWKLDDIEYRAIDAQNHLDLSVEQAMIMDKYIDPLEVYDQFNKHIDTYDKWVQDLSGSEYKTTVYVFSTKDGRYNMEVSSSTGDATIKKV